MKIGDLLRERERLYGVIEEAKEARARIRSINVLIAMYGGDEKVPKPHNIRAIHSELCVVPDCGKPQKYRGICILHYTIWYKKKDGWQDINKHVLPRQKNRRVS